MTESLSPGARLKAFREARGITLRGAAKQLCVQHPALKDWEEGNQSPSPPYRAAIEVWTGGEIRPDEWPLSTRERVTVENAARVVPCTESTRDLSVAANESSVTGPGIKSVDDSGETPAAWLPKKSG